MPTEEKQPEQPLLSSLLIGELEDLRAYADEVCLKLSEFERKLLGQEPLHELKEIEGQKYPETITGQLKRRVDETKSTLKNINRLVEELRKF